MSGLSSPAEMILRLLLAITAAGRCTGNGNQLEREELESLKEIKTLQIFGDSVVIVSKNETKFEDATSDEFDEYLRNRVIRIKSPFDEDKYYDLEMKDLTGGNEDEARSRRQSLKKILIPILLALKIKSTILVPIFMAFVALIAVKGFWAGMTALFVSKAIALKVFYQAQNKHDHDHEDHDEYEDREEYHEYHDHHDHSFHQPPPRMPYETSYHGPRQHVHPSSEEREKPIVIYLSPDKQNAKFGNRHEETSDVSNYYTPEAWNSWGRENPDLERQRWQNGSPNWGQGPL